MSDNMKDDIIVKDSNVKITTLEEEMKKSYLDYAMSVIVSRALPDVRDGLKPVHRRILFAMKEGGYDYNRPFRKSARIVGDVMGKYHPHGDMAIYDAMVRLEQKFSMRLPLVSGQGNFGSMDGDGAAAMRYTEAKMAKSAHELLKDIDKETVNFIPNYDETVYEPVVLPAAYPNILVNGASGIAVGMATNIPPHNLGELIDACCALVDNADLTIDELMEHYIFGPDFPTGGIILGQQGIHSAFTTGRGSVMMRAKVDIEEIRKDREAIIVTEIPYQVNKSRMVEIIAELARDKKVEGISDIRDESDRQGIRVVIEIKRDFQTNVVLNQLYHHSPLQTSFSVNCLALNNNRPELMNLKDVLLAFLKFREEVITKRTVFELKKSRQRAHVLGGLAVAVENVDEVIELIRSSSNPQQAKELLLGREWKIKSIAPMIKLLDEDEDSVEKDTYIFSEEQVKGILELRLQRLTGMERDKIIKDLEEISIKIKEYLALLNSRELLLEKLKKELIEVKEEFDTPRRTEILDIEYSKDIEGLIQREDMIVTVSDTGYIKRVPLSTYSSQRRGGKGRRGMTMKDEDIVIDIFMAGTHQMILFFSTKGLVYQLKTYKLPLGTPQSRGKAMVNLLPLSEGEKISTIVVLPENLEECEDKYVMFATKLGNVRRNRLSDFMNIRANGKIAMKLADVSDSLIAVRVCTEEQDILVSSKKGMSIRTAVENVRIFSSRNSTGIRGIRLGADDEVIGMSVLRHKRLDLETRNAYLKMRRADELDSELDNENNLDSNISLSMEQFNELLAQEEIILTISSQGYGKRSSSYEYRVTGRGGKGIAAMKMGDKNKELVASVIVSEDNDVVLVTSSGQIIRCPVSDIRLAGRNTQGVRLFKIDSNDSVVSVSIVPSDKMEDSLEEASDENVNSEEEPVSTQDDSEQE